MKLLKNILGTGLFFVLLAFSTSGFAAQQHYPRHRHYRHHHRPVRHYHHHPVAHRPGVHVDIHN
jgi:hypothetical protein